MLISKMVKQKLLIATATCFMMLMLASIISVFQQASIGNVFFMTVSLISFLTIVLYSTD